MKHTLFNYLLLFLIIATFLPLYQASSSSSSAAVDLGTTLVALHYKDGVIVAADTRTSISSTYVSHRMASKIVPVSSHCLIARSGSAADTQQLVDFVKEERLDRYYRQHGRLLTVSQVGKMIESVIATDRDENSRTRSISLLIAGYDPYDQCGRIYSLSPSGVLLQEDTFAAAGSGSTFVLGYLDHHQHHEKKIVMDEETAIQQCVQAVQLAITRDAASGGLVRVFICNQQGIQERLVYPPAHKNKMEAASMVGAKES